MTIRECVAGILATYHEKAGQLSAEDWWAIADLVTEVVPPFPRIPPQLFVPLGRLFVPAAVELVVVRERRVLLVRRDFFGSVDYHTPGTCIAPGETWFETAQRCADSELNVKVVSVEPLCPPINHYVSPRFHDLSVLLHCEIEGDPAVGEWFGRKERPKMLGVQSEYWALIEPLLR